MSPRLTNWRSSMALRRWLVCYELVDRISAHIAQRKFGRAAICCFILAALGRGGTNV